MLNWGRRTGKSTLAINYVQVPNDEAGHALQGAIAKPGRYWIVAPTYQQARNIYWKDLINQVDPAIVVKKNESGLFLTLFNGSLIELKGADNPDSLRGAGVNGVVLDEFAFMKPEVWDEILRPMLADSGGWALFISTPDGFNHFFDVVEASRENDRWFYSHATTYDNPHIPDSEVDEIRHDLMRKGDDGDIRFRQEYLAEFKKRTGLVYKQFSRDVHLVEPAMVPREGIRVLGVDFGFTNPLAALYVLIDFDNNWWLYDELYKSGLTTDRAADIIKQKMGGEHFSHLIGDSAAAQAIADFSSQGVHITPVEKTHDAIQQGIRLINDKLSLQAWPDGSMKPKLYVSRACQHTIWEFETYVYPEKKDNHNVAEDPVKENDHAMDALRYLAVTLNRPVGGVDVFIPEDMAAAMARHGM